MKRNDQIGCDLRFIRPEILLLHHALYHRLVSLGHAPLHQHILHFLAQVIQLVGKEHMVIEIQNGGQLVPILSKKDMVVDFRIVQRVLIEAVVNGAILFDRPHIRLQLGLQLGNIVPQVAQRTKHDQLIQVVEVIINRCAVVARLRRNSANGQILDSIPAEQFFRCLNEVNHDPLSLQRQVIIQCFVFQIHRITRPFI